MSDTIENFKQILEAAIFAAGEPVSVEQLQQLFGETFSPTVRQVRDALLELGSDYAECGVELIEVASGFRFQARADYAVFLSRLNESKPIRYTRAFLETLALIAYRQPITRGEIEEVRGVAVSSDIIKKLLDRDWIKVVGTKDVPGKPSLYATTKSFLDYFNLQALSDLPDLKEPSDLNEMEQKLGTQLSLEMPFLSEEMIKNAEIVVEEELVEV